ERWIEVALDHGGKFVEIRHQLEELGIFVNAVAAFFCVRLKLAPDFIQALGRPDDHSVAAKLLFVLGKGAYAKRGPAQETMAAGGIPSGNPAVGKLEGLAVEDPDDPADRTDEPCSGEAR